MCHRPAQAYGEFELLVFGDDVILNKEVEDWPLCDALLSWHSDGFPLRKARLTGAHHWLSVHSHTCPCANGAAVVTVCQTQGLNHARGHTPPACTLCCSMRGFGAAKSGVPGHSVSTHHQLRLHRRA